MANRNLGAWLPITTDGSQVIVPNLERSAVMDVLRTPVNMTGTDVLQVPTLNGADVHLGETLTEDTNDGDKVTMYARTFNGKQSLSEREVEIIRANGDDAFKRYDDQWMSNFHVAFDNASLGTSAARSTTDSVGRPYDSVYYSVKTNAASMYSASGLTYATGNTAVSRLESSRFGGNNIVIFAHPGVKGLLRGLVDGQQRPIFIECNTGRVLDDTLFGYPVVWTRGAVVTASMEQATNGGAVGNKLLIAANPNYLVWGEGAVPAHRVIPASINPNAFAHVLQHRAVEGFVITNPNAASVLEINA